MTNQGNLFGKWSIAATFTPVANSTVKSARFNITGSDASDGHYLVGPGPVTLPSVTGSSWTISMDLGTVPEPVGSKYLLLTISRTDSVASDGSLVVTLEGSLIANQGPTRSDRGDYLLLTCTNLDQELNPLPIQGTAIAFTVAGTK